MPYWMECIWEQIYWILRYCCGGCIPIWISDFFVFNSDLSMFSQRDNASGAIIITLCNILSLYLIHLMYFIWFEDKDIILKFWHFRPFVTSKLWGYNFSTISSIFNQTKWLFFKCPVLFLCKNLYLILCHNMPYNGLYLSFCILTKNLVKAHKFPLKISEIYLIFYKDAKIEI